MLIRIVVKDNKDGSELGWTVLPLSAIQPGYRLLPLRVSLIAIPAATNHL